MGTLNLSVNVRNISPTVTVEELCIFFSFCGSVEYIKLKSEGSETQPYSATVAFKQPYAFQTALLLDGTILVDRELSISAMDADPSAIPITSPSPPTTNKASDQGSKPAGIPQQTIPMPQVVAKEGQEALNLAREMDEKHKVREAGKELVYKTRMAVSAAEQTAGRVGTAIVHSNRFSKGALWLASVLDRASKYAAELGNMKHRDETNSRKQK